MNAEIESVNHAGIRCDEEIPMRVVEISKQPVELFKILKFEGLVSSGGEAKLVIADGMVQVNGEVETRKRKKIVSGDTIEFGQDIIRIEFNGQMTE